ncbi:MAG: hypothetical protein K2K80_06425 [Clostridia bacterium]|nr:hypothetical protein [Clostridia bacterium]
MKGLKIAWIIIALCVLLGGIIWLIVAPSWTVAGIWYGACIVINFPGLIGMIKDCDAGGERLGMFLMAILLAPFWVLVNAYYKFKYMD